MTTFDELASAYQTESQQQQRQKATERYTAQLAQEREERQQQRTYRSKAREVHRQWQTGTRAQQREARAYAELWWQALREWDAQSGMEVVSSRNLYSTRPPSQNPTVGQYTSGGSITELRFRVLHTPIGLVSESRVAALCNADPLLEEVRRGKGLATLIHASGRGWAGKRAREYGAAVLGLARDLGDAKAAEVLTLVFAEE